MALIQLKLNKIYTFNGTKAQLEERILVMRRPRAEERNGRYRFVPYISVGTLISNIPGLSSRIYVDATVAPISDNMQEVRLTTNVRVEHYFITAVCILFISVAIFSEHDWKMALISIVMLPIMFLWFHMVYRAQENEVVKCIETQLDLVEA